MTPRHAYDYYYRNISASTLPTTTCKIFTFEFGLSMRNYEDKSIIVNLVKEVQTWMTG